MFTEKNRGTGFCLSGCNPCQTKLLRGGPTGNAETERKERLEYTLEGGTPGPQLCCFLGCTPMIIWAPLVLTVTLCQATNSKLTISIGSAADGSAVVNAEMRVKSCCGEEEEKLSGIRGAEMEQTMWTNISRRGTSQRMASALTLTMQFGKKTIQCDQTGGERACREINEFIYKHAPNVMAAPKQEVMVVQAPQAMSETAAAVTPMETTAPAPAPASASASEAASAPASASASAPPGYSETEGQPTTVDKNASIESSK